MENMIRPDLGDSGYRIKAFIITMMNNNTSVVATRKLLHSIKQTKSKIQPFIQVATTPEDINKHIHDHFPEEIARGMWFRDENAPMPNGSLNWTWPINPTQDGLDIATGLYRKTYRAADQRNVMACSISHMRLWQHCIDIDQPIMILEHDAFFTRKFNYRHLVHCGETRDQDGVEVPYDLSHPVTPKDGVRFGGQSSLITDKMEIPNPKYTGQFTGGVIGLNDPIGATRKARVFDEKVKQTRLDALPGKLGISQVPYVDDAGDDPLPSGLAGNSAYIIKPWAAKKLLEKTVEIGVWPNDALMCRQFFPWLQVYFPYYTQVQRTASTTTL
jgi:GR25 family glycosyltransferase involved in LPS biosynthesis